MWVFLSSRGKGGRHGRVEKGAMQGEAQPATIFSEQRPRRQGRLRAGLASSACAGRVPSVGGGEVNHQLNARSLGRLPR